MKDRTQWAGYCRGIPRATILIAICRAICISIGALRPISGTLRVLIGCSSGVQGNRLVSSRLVGVQETPVVRHSVQHPEALGDDLWVSPPSPPPAVVIGIAIEEVRLTPEEGMLTRS